MRRATPSDATADRIVCVCLRRVNSSVSPLTLWWLPFSYVPWWVLSLACSISCSAERELFSLSALCLVSDFFFNLPLFSCVCSRLSLVTMSSVFGKEVDGLSSSRDSSNWMTRISEQAGDLTTSVRVRAQTVAQTLTGDKKAMQPSQRPSLRYQYMNVKTFIVADTLDLPSTGCSLVPGGNGMVFHYMSVNNLSGIMVAPVQGAVIGGHLHVAVVRNFCKACISIRHVLVKQSEV